MNVLIVGSDKSKIVERLPETFLIIDDGDLLDKISLPKRRKITELDFSTHSFNPLKGMDYRKAREFISVLDAVFPEGENTLTKRYSNFVLLRALLSHPKTLETLIEEPSQKDTGAVDAYQKIQTLLLSPVLKNVLTRPTNFSFKGTILARLDRAKLGDFDCFVLANLLISQYRGAVVLPDFGFYQCPFHTALLRQDRLIAGINSFDEVPRFRSRLLLVDTKLAGHSTPADAELLAVYSRLAPSTNAYNDFIQRSIGESA